VRFTALWVGRVDSRGVPGLASGSLTAAQQILIHALQSRWPEDEWILPHSPSAASSPAANTLHSQLNSSRFHRADFGRCHGRLGSPPVFTAIFDTPYTFATLILHVHAPVTQWKECWTSNPVVAGSIPAGGTQALVAQLDSASLS
jgi:hypothetical protein